MVRFFKKYHKWVALFLSLFLILFVLSGIVLNHRDWFSGMDVSRSMLPKEYRYKNWNNSSVRATLKLNSDSILLYGNIGIWLTDSNWTNFVPFMQGFPKGVDNRKINKLLQTPEGKLYAATLFGLFEYDYSEKAWLKSNLPVDEQVVDLVLKNGQLLALTRSHLLAQNEANQFEILPVPPPENYKPKASLFKTMWFLHSGEIYGHVGKLLVDLIGLVFVFLIITGLIYFINPYLLRKRRRKKQDSTRIKKSSKWNLKWHNKMGWITFPLLLIIAITGIFLRPPLLIPIIGIKVGVIPYSTLDSKNPWNDKLRRIVYRKDQGEFIFSTSEGVFSVSEKLTGNLKSYAIQPPISVMGANVFELYDDESLLIGSFLGLFLWSPETGEVQNYVDKRPYVPVRRMGPPIGQHIVTGYTKDFKGEEFYFDYVCGVDALRSSSLEFPTMPQQLVDIKKSLWNVALEVHTGRIYSFFLGSFYILVVPLSGLLTVFILISGFIVWYKKHRRRKPRRKRIKKAC